MPGASTSAGVPQAAGEKAGAEEARSDGDAADEDAGNDNTGSHPAEALSEWSDSEAIRDGNNDAETIVYPAEDWTIGGTLMSDPEACIEGGIDDTAG